jgi:RsiW-degrading membrane proteinase PrsW (M82 family)
VLALIVAPVYGAYLLFLDPLEHEPPWLLGLAFAWGAGVATLGGGLATAALEASTGAVLGLSAGARDALGTVVFAPVMEEIAKGAFVIALFLLARHEFDDVADGIVYGGLVGLGFAVVEDLLYYAEAFLQEGIAGAGALFFVRGILTGFGHPFYTAVTGLALGLAAQVRSSLARWLLPPVGLAGAMVLHGLWNGAVTLAQHDESGMLAVLAVFGYPALVLLPGAVVLAVIAFVQARRRARDVRRYLGEAVGRGLADPTDLEALTRPWRRRSRQLETLVRYGLRAFWLRRRLDIALVDWAYRRWHRERGQRLPRYLALFEAEALEARLRQWRDELQRIQGAASR